ncbi:hypothetical protein KFL_002030200 [Klebsormidium nitens]|uniref:Uncharacterized protein n=1 Tax=Klebsormidium nitens TaxID=105231 RepID=A0A1Y1I9I2_KLENI|nr:hypothetical protein KFL_002030200 [Klebsormidium nitens]|eukprot:GAQ84738.1 hypothetical protein KFL_002030200 [Klebsormidium nitens]
MQVVRAEDDIRGDIPSGAGPCNETWQEHQAATRSHVLDLKVLSSELACSQRTLGTARVSSRRLDFLLLGIW